MEVVGLRQGINPQVIVRLTDGLQLTLPLDATNYASSVTNSSLSPAAHLLDLAGLCQMVEWLERLHRAEGGPSPLPGEGL